MSHSHIIIKGERDFHFINLAAFPVISHGLDHIGRKCFKLKVFCDNKRAMTPEQKVFGAEQKTIGLETNHEVYEEDKNYDFIMGWLKNTTVGNFDELFK